MSRIAGPPDLVFESFETTPTAHDEGIVGSYHSDDINALCFELFVLLEVGGQVVRVAGRLIGCGEPKLGCRDGKIHTVKAPGTEKMTTFFPFHSSVLSLVAVRVSRVIVSRR